MAKETKQGKHLVFKDVEVSELEDRVLRFRASDETLDSDRDRIRVDGWKMRDYIPFQPFHDYRKLPLGKAINSFVKDGGLYLDVRFPSAEELTKNTDLKPEDIDDHIKEINTVYALYKSGYLKAVSVGFRGLEGSPNEEGGVDWEKQEIYELSAVIIGANPNAQIEARMKMDSIKIDASLFAKDLSEKIENAKEALTELKEALSFLDDVSSEESPSVDDEKESLKDVIEEELEARGEKEQKEEEEDLYFEPVLSEQNTQEKDNSSEEYFIDFDDIEDQEKTDDRWFMSFE